MPVVIVTSNGAGSGKTGVAAAIARHYAYQGLAVRLARVASDAPNGAADAAYFGSLPFTPGSAASPVPTSEIADPADRALLIVETEDPAAVSVPGAAIVVVARGAAPKALPDGTAAVVITAVSGLTGGRTERPESGPTTVSLGDDRILAGFSVAEARQMLRAEVLVEGDVSDTTCDHLVIAPIASDAGQPYFRRFASKAVVVRFDKTDQHLAAMQSDPACLILTGGRRPSEYLFDAAGAKGIPVLLSRTDTENTVIALEGLFDNTRFIGERKLDRMCELLDESGLFDALGR